VEAAGLDVSYHGGSSYPGHLEEIGMVGLNANRGGGGGHGGGRGGNGGSGSAGNGLAKSDSEAQLLMLDHAVEEALKEIERRGWQPPITAKTVQEELGGGGNDSGTPTVASAASMPTSQSLADIRASIQQNYKRNSPPTPTDAMTPKASTSSLPEDAPVG
jgi:hypothetical protein